LIGVGHLIADVFEDEAGYLMAANSEQVLLAVQFSLFVGPDCVLVIGLQVHEVLEMF
jgi:hypothetical protein